MMNQVSRRTMSKVALVAALAGTVSGLALRSEAKNEPQPHMVAALTSLQTARRQLAMGSTDKGGFRVRAIASVDRAIADVRKGIAYDNAHPDGKPNRSMRGMKKHGQKR